MCASSLSTSVEVTSSMDPLGDLLAAFGSDGRPTMYGDDGLSDEQYGLESAAPDAGYDSRHPNFRSISTDAGTTFLRHLFVHHILEISVEFHKERKYTMRVLVATEVLQ